MRGNKGEWSELYAFFKLLAEGRLYAADADTNKTEDIYYDVLKAIRRQTDGNWEFVRNGKIKVVKAETGEEVLSMPIELFKEQADLLLREMKNERSKTGAFEVPEVWSFAQRIKCNTLKAKSTDKSDIKLVVHDFRTGTNPTLGFSIKSQMGSASTLLNASTATNFTYRVVGHSLTDEEKERFNGYKLFKEKFEHLEQIGAYLQFANMDSNVFEFNLKLVDTQLPKIVASVVEKFYKGTVNKIKNLTDLVIRDNPLAIDSEDAETFYTYKIKELLTNIALGLVPSRKWSGTYDATGGYIIVKEGGDVLCYHIYNRNEFREYLFRNTKLDTPSKTRHGFGIVVDTAEGQVIKLNLQIRFIK